ncbi:unnamed protein product [Sphagnum balticum]|jgi:hypothetical protein
MEDNFLKESHQFSGKSCLHEGLDCDDDFLGIFAFGEFSADHLVDDFFPVLILVRKDKLPKFFGLPHHQILCLDSVKGVSVSAINEFLITLSRVSLVGYDCQVRVPILAEFTYHLGVVILIGGQKLLGILMSVYFNLGCCIVHRWDLNIFGNSIFQPAFKDRELVSFFEFMNEFLHRNCRSDNLENLLYVGLFALEIDESSKNNWNCLRILAHFKEIDFDVFGEVILVEISCEFVILLMGIAKEDDRFGVSELEFKEDIFHFYGIVAVALSSNDFLN